MSGSTFGRLFRLTTFGESHGAGLGGVVDGCPAGIPLEEAVVQAALDRRRPGGQQGSAGTTRKEADAVRLLSGVFEGVTTGTPIGFFIANTDQRSRDYGPLASVWRPGHADMTYDAKYGVRDYRGGGRSSGRETAARVAGGAVAAALLAAEGIRIRACTLEIGGIAAPGGPDFDPDGAALRPYCAPDAATAEAWEARMREVRGQGDTLGGLVRVEALGVPAGLGEPVFDKLDALLAHALMSVGAVKGVEVGDGFAAARSLGSVNNDPFLPLPSEAGPHDRPDSLPDPDSGQCFDSSRQSAVQAGAPAPASPGFVMPSNHCGGILGGISTGQTIILTVAIKPIPSIALEQQSVDRQGRGVSLRVGGRHDICAIPRVVPVLEAMTALTLADALLMQRRRRTDSAQAAARPQGR